MFLGIDIGTSGVKSILMEDSGSVVAQATAPIPISRPQPLWSEQDPADWWTATETSVQSLPESLRSRVQSIGLSGQMHGATVLDKNDAPLRPAILWNDGRSADACRWLEEHVPNLHDVSGNLAMPGFTAPKLVWLRDHEPDIFDQISKVLLPKDYVRLLMTGEYASDMSDAAGTLWLDVAKRDWSEALLSACGLHRSHMPNLVEGPQVSGQLSSNVAEKWGVPKDVPVVGGGGDNAAGAVGMGIAKQGDTFLSLGTSGVLFVANESYAPIADDGVHTFCHALPGLWHQMSVMLSAASCVDWAARLTSASGAGELIAAAEAANLFGEDVPTFLPYLSGERTPHNNPNAKGMLFGLLHTSDRAAIGQAVLEGVAMAFADGLDVLLGNAEIDSINVIGGGARSAYWGKILAAALARPMVYRKYADVGPALGAARLAQMGYASQTKADFQAPSIEAVIEPDQAGIDLMASKLTRFRALYQSNKDHF